MYKKILQPQLTYIDTFVRSVQTAFVQLYSQELDQRLTQFPFTDTFFKELNAAETSSGFLGRKKTKMRTWNQSRKKKNATKPKKKSQQKKPALAESDSEEDAKDNDSDESDEQIQNDNRPDDVEEVTDAPTGEDPIAVGEEVTDVSEEGKDMNEMDELLALQAKLKLNRIQARRKGPGRHRKKASSKNKSKSAGKTSKKKTESSKIKVTKKLMDSLDASNSKRGDVSSGEVVDYQDESEVDADVKAENAGASSWSIPGLGSVTGMLKSLTGQKELTAADLEKPLIELKDQLVAKNVAMEIATNLCDSVNKSLIGQKAGTFTRIKTLVSKALHDALLRILTPKKSIDIVRSALEARKTGEPFTIVFIGINGVGKSTSLSKVCYYLMSKKFKVMIAACDTFRSGAVEQLEEHGKRLNVPVYNKGYHKDPSEVARCAVLHGKKEGYDVVLIDTAGRMQNNTRLMKALAKLVENNNPHLVLFVGEALVGNDGVDQLSMFNKALIDYSSKQTPRGIDGIILTKFDTVDEKVGASLSMVYRTGQPIVFVGTGQKYTNLKLLNPTTIINALFSS